MSYNKYHIFLSKAIGEAYKSKDSRKKEISFDNFKLDYMKDKSNDLFAHYENEEMVLVAIHGASALEQQLAAISKFLSPFSQNKVINSFCKKYDELVKEDKKVFLTGHSLGAFAIAECSRGKKKFPTVMFAPYVPHPIGKIKDTIKSEKLFQKVFFTNDKFANNLILSLGKLNNAIVFKPNTVLQTFNSHALFTFTKPIHARRFN